MTVCNVDVMMMMCDDVAHSYKPTELIITQLC